MVDSLLTILILLAALAVGYAALRWTAKMERRSQMREMMDRVYYLRRPMRQEAPEWKRTETQ